MDLAGVCLHHVVGRPVRAGQVHHRPTDTAAPGSGRLLDIEKAKIPRPRPGSPGACYDDRSNLEEVGGMGNSTIRRTVSISPKLDGFCQRHLGRMPWVGSGLYVLLICAGLFMAPAAANTDDDPLGLLVGYDVSSYYSLGEDHWEVWVCESPEGDLDLSASEIAGVLESELVPYFDWLSGGRYRPIFRAGTPGKAAAPGFGSCL